MKTNRPAKAASTGGAKGSADLQIVVDKPIYDLLVAGTINQILTWKQQEEITEKKLEPKVIAVISTEGDDPVIRKVKHMDTVAFGYCPIGYPEAYKADRRSTRFILEEADESGAVQEESKEPSTTTTE